MRPEEAKIKHKEYMEQALEKYKEIVTKRLVRDYREIGWFSVIKHTDHQSVNLNVSNFGELLEPMVEWLESEGWHVRQPIDPWEGLYVVAHNLPPEQEKPETCVDKIKKFLYG